MSTENTKDDLPLEEIVAKTISEKKEMNAQKEEPVDESKTVPAAEKKDTEPVVKKKTIDTEEKIEEKKKVEALADDTVETSEDGEAEPVIKLEIPVDSDETVEVSDDDLDDTPVCEEVDEADVKEEKVEDISELCDPSDDKQVDEGKSQDEIDAEIVAKYADKIKESVTIADIIKSDTTLTEDFKVKAVKMFEDTVREKGMQLEEQYAKKLSEEKERYQDHLAERVDQYLTAMAEEWLNENRAVVTENLRMEIAESFVSGIKRLFSESYIEVPVSKLDLAEKIQKENAQLKESLSQKEKSLRVYQGRYVALKKESLVREATAGMTDIDASKFLKLSEGINYTDETSYKVKLTELKNIHFTSPEVKQKVEANLEINNLSENTSLAQATARIFDR